MKPFIPQATECDKLTNTHKDTDKVQNMFIKHYGILQSASAAQKQWKREKQHKKTCTKLRKNKYRVKRNS